MIGIEMTMAKISMRGLSAAVFGLVLALACFVVYHFLVLGAFLGAMSLLRRCHLEPYSAKDRASRLEARAFAEYA